MGCGFRKVKLATPILGKCQHEKIAPDDFNPRHEFPLNVIGVFLGPLTRPLFNSRATRPIDVLFTLH